MYEFVYIIVFFYLNGATPFENKLRYNYATSDLYGYATRTPLNGNRKSS